MENGTWISLRTGSSNINSVIPWRKNHPYKQYRYATIINRQEIQLPELGSARPTDGNQMLCVFDDPSDIRFTVKVLGLCEETNFIFNFVNSTLNYIQPGEDES